MREILPILIEPALLREDEDYGHYRLRGPMLRINDSGFLHFEFIEVVPDPDAEGAWMAAAPEFAPEVEAIYQLHDAPLVPVAIRGRQYFGYACPSA